jgi:hypothetical protein
MTREPRAAGSYLRFLALGIGASVAAGLVGYLPTVRLAGPEAVPALIAGCFVSFLASALGAVPVALARNRPDAVKQGPQVALMAMGIRLGAVVLLGIAAVLSGLFETAPLVIWIAIGYAVQLVLDTGYALKAFQR